MSRWMWTFVAGALLATGCAAQIHAVKPEGGAVRLSLLMPEAARVELVCSAYGYAAVPAEKNSKGAWEVRVPGRKGFDYFYLVDGEPYTPPCAFSRPDGFGGTTCIHEPDM